MALPSEEDRFQLDVPASNEAVGIIGMHYFRKNWAVSMFPAIARPRGQPATYEGIYNDMLLSPIPIVRWLSVEIKHRKTLDWDEDGKGFNYPHMMVHKDKPGLGDKDLYIFLNRTKDVMAVMEGASHGRWKREEFTDTKKGYKPCMYWCCPKDLIRWVRVEP